MTAPIRSQQIPPFLVQDLSETSNLAHSHALSSQHNARSNQHIPQRSRELGRQSLVLEWVSIHNRALFVREEGSQAPDRH